MTSKVSELVEGNLDRTSIEVIIKAAKENDTLAFRILHEAVSHIGVALADVVNLLNPSVIVFGGPLFREGHDLLVEPLQRVIRQRALEKSANEVRFMISPLGSEAGALGAARLVSKKVLKSLYEEECNCVISDSACRSALEGSDPDKFAKNDFSINSELAAVGLR